MSAGGLKPWQYVTLVLSCTGSMLAGASVVHQIFRPDLSLPDVSEAPPKEGSCDEAPRPTAGDDFTQAVDGRPGAGANTR